MPATYEIAFRLPVSLHVKTEEIPEEFTEEWKNGGMTLSIRILRNKEMLRYQEEGKSLIMNYNSFIKRNLYLGSNILFHASLSVKRKIRRCFHKRKVKK